MKIILSILISIFYFSSALADNSMAKVCEQNHKERSTYYESKKKMILEKIKTMKKDTPQWEEFEYSPQYEWVRFTVPNSLPEFSKPHDDSCAVMYEDYVTHSKGALNATKLTSWNNCLITEYKEDIPEMAQKILKCHKLSH